VAQIGKMGTKGRKPKYYPITFRKKGNRGPKVDQRQGAKGDAKLGMNKGKGGFKTRKRTEY